MKAPVLLRRRSMDAPPTAAAASAATATQAATSQNAAPPRRSRHSASSYITVRAVDFIAAVPPRFPKVTNEDGEPLTPLPIATEPRPPSYTLRRCGEPVESFPPAELLASTFIAPDSRRISRLNAACAPSESTNAALEASGLRRANFCENTEPNPACMRRSLPIDFCASHNVPLSASMRRSWHSPTDNVEPPTLSADRFSFGKALITRKEKPAVATLDLALESTTTFSEVEVIPFSDVEPLSGDASLSEAPSSPALTAEEGDLPLSDSTISFAQPSDAQSCDAQLDDAQPDDAESSVDESDDAVADDAQSDDAEPVDAHSDDAQSVDAQPDYAQSEDAHSNDAQPGDEPAQDVSSKNDILWPRPERPSLILSQSARVTFLPPPAPAFPSGPSYLSIPKAAPAQASPPSRASSALPPVSPASPRSTARMSSDATTISSEGGVECVSSRRWSSLTRPRASLGASSSSVTSAGHSASNSCEVEGGLVRAPSVARRLSERLARLTKRDVEVSPLPTRRSFRVSKGVAAPRASRRSVDIPPVAPAVEPQYFQDDYSNFMSKKHKTPSPRKMRQSLLRLRAADPDWGRAYDTPSAQACAVSVTTSDDEYSPDIV